ncbi:MAG: rod shape-determining protein RodA [Sphingobacteriia bacterium]|jgi:rod shape determining protein RodA|nr:rod shape-determining protein RodA [Sphingobacteriia bacterium]
MARNDNDVFYGVDRTTVLIYVLLVIMGWLNIYAAVFNEEHQNIFDTTQKYGKQLIWISGAAIIAFSILLIDANFYTAFSYFFYGFFLLANILVIWLGREVKGSRSWYRFGDFGIQPAEFMKFATNLAMAKFLSNQNLLVSDRIRLRLRDLIKHYGSTLLALALIMVPLLLIKILQDETGLAIVFIAFIIVLYREGLSVNFLIFGILAAILFVLALIIPSLSLLITLAIIGASSFLFVKRNRKSVIIILLIYGAAAGVVLGTNYVYNHLESHQKVRIDVLLGRGTVNLKKEGYNVNQAKIAIGSGGFLGKGYLQGTQTKYDFVPEQDTDFIFCTVGEEWGFVGSLVVIFLELFLILRLIYLSERQRSDYSRIYGYGVAAVLFFHLAVNIGMTIGLMPVIGIPLPFFSYGGSSLWSFTILLFIFIKLDANRLLILR